LRVGPPKDANEYLILY